MSKLIKGLAALAATTLLAAPAATSMGAPAPAASAGTSVSTSSWHQSGNWKKSHTYHYGDVVRYRGKSYVAIRKNHNHKPRGSKLWRVVAADGSAGSNGTDGTNGSNGATGATGAIGPSWLVKDKAGTTLGVYAGSGWRGWGSQYPSTNVLFQGGLWSYRMEGGYSVVPAQWSWHESAQGVHASGGLPGLEYWTAIYLNDTCTGTAYDSTQTQAEASSLTNLAATNYREVYEASAGSFTGYKVGSAVTDNRDPNNPGQYKLAEYGWYWLGQSRTCQAIEEGWPWLVELTPVPLPPVSVGWLSIVAP